MPNTTRQALDAFRRYTRRADDGRWLIVLPDGHDLYAAIDEWDVHGLLADDGRWNDQDEHVFELSKRGTEVAAWMHC